MTILASGLFITVNTHWSSSFILCCQSLLETLSRLQLQHKEAIVTCVNRHNARAIKRDHLGQNEIEGNYIPPMSGLIAEKWKCKLMVWVTERRELSVIELSLWLTYSTYSNAGEKRKKTTTKTIKLCQLQNKRCLCLLHDEGRYKKCWSLYIMWMLPL